MKVEDLAVFTERLKEKLTPLYTVPNTPNAHDVWHVIRMVKLGSRIRQHCQLTFSLQEFEIAAWLHNIDRVQPYLSDIELLESSGHSYKEALAVVVERFFRDRGNPFFEGVEAEARIIRAVVQHSKKDDEAGDSHLLTALRVADKLDRLNPLGVLSVASFRSSQVPLYDPKQPLACESTAEGRMKSVYEEFFRLIEWVGMLPSDDARGLIVKEELLALINFVRAVGAQLSRECDVPNIVEDNIKKALGAYYKTYAF